MIDLSLISTGEDFELFCEDLLRARGLTIQSKVARGPDRGQDIVAASTDTDYLGFSRSLRILVECKHFARSGRAVREADVGNIVERAIAGNCNRYILITSTVPATSVLHQIQGISSNPAIPIEATVWAKNDIHLFLAEFPDLKKRYFSADHVAPSTTAVESEQRRDVLVHAHPDFSPQIQKLCKCWNEAQTRIQFTTIRPSQDSERSLLTSGTIHEDAAAAIAHSVREDAGYGPDAGIVMFCEQRLHGGPYYQLFASGTHGDEEPPNTATISLRFMRVIASSNTSDGKLLPLIVQGLLHVFANDAGLEAHDETRGCIMDFDNVMTDILKAVRGGPCLCEPCKRNPHKIGGGYVLSIVDATYRYLGDESDIRQVDMRMHLRDERREKVGDDWSYDVALSFAGEDRRFAEFLAIALKKRGVSVFYDAFEKVELWGQDLYSYLFDLYNLRARYCVMFISKHYEGKLWTDHERRAAQEKAFRENRKSVLPIRLDDTEVPRTLSTVSYLTWSYEGADGIAEVIVQKLRQDPK